MKTKNESLDDIIFENRNKEYGAYDLRKKYSKRGMIALIISLFILFSAVGGPLIANIINGSVNPGDIKPVDGVVTMGFTSEKPIVAPPKLPDPPKNSKIPPYKAPKVVENIEEEDLDMPGVDDLKEMGNNEVGDTASFIPEKIVIDKEPVVETVVEVFELNEKPLFPGGDAGIIKYVAENTHYPAVSIEKEIEGTVYIRFVVTRTGEIGDARVMRPIDPDLEAEALRVIRSMPKWTPGKINGNPVNVWFIIPVKFVLKKQ